jgi:hypothetical protein
MDARRESELTSRKNRTTVERKSEREFVVARTFNGPVEGDGSGRCQSFHLFRSRHPTR